MLHSYIIWCLLVEIAIEENEGGVGVVVQEIKNDRKKLAFIVLRFKIDDIDWNAVMEHLFLPTSAEESMVIKINSVLTMN